MKSSAREQLLTERLGPSDAPTVVVHGAGRVVLLGQHIEHCGGFVLTATINRGTNIAARLRTDGQATLRGGSDAGSPTDVVIGGDLDTGPAWFAPCARVFARAKRDGLLDMAAGIDMALTDDLPPGFDLGGDASAAMAALTALSALAPASFSTSDPAQRATLAAQASPAGFTDALAIAVGAVHTASLMDPHSRQFRPVGLRDAAIVLAKPRTHVDLPSHALEERFARLDEALEKLRSFRYLQNLVQIRPSDLSGLKTLLDADTFGLVRYVITEHTRVISAAAALEQGNSAALGELFRQSHESLRDDFGVSSPELDELVAVARTTAGCIGARAAGASTINLIQRASAEGFADHVARTYAARTGVEVDVAVLETADGTFRWPEGTPSA